jgi:hypothetical protein
MGKGFGMEKQGSDISLYLVPSTETSVTAADGSIQVTWGKGFGMEQKGSDNNLYRAQKTLLQPQMAP